MSLIAARPPPSLVGRRWCHNFQIHHGLTLNPEDRIGFNRLIPLVVPIAMLYGFATVPIENHPWPMEIKASLEVQS